MKVEVVRFEKSFAHRPKLSKQIFYIGFNDFDVEIYIVKQMTNICFDILLIPMVKSVLLDIF